MQLLMYYINNCNKIWMSGKGPTQWCESIMIPLPKKGSLRKCGNYRTISLISHASKVMLKILLNRLTPHIEGILRREQAGFRAGRSTVEQIFNIWIIAERYNDHRNPLFNNFIDFRKAFDGVWQDAPWRIMRKHGLSPTIISLIEALYQQSVCAVQVGPTVSNWFHATVGVRQGCIVSPSLFNLFVEEIISLSIANSPCAVNIGGRSLSNLRFADDIDLMAGSGRSCSHSLMTLLVYQRLSGWRST